jgi:GAF domain-containing protein
VDPATHPTALAHVRALLGVVSALRTGSVDGVLAAVAEAIAGPMRFGTVAVNLYRPAWDDLEVVLVRGAPEAREALLGTRTAPSDWRPLLDVRYDRGGAYFVPYDQHDWDRDGVLSYVPDIPAPAEADGWHPEDALLLPLRSSADELLGIISVDEPADGRRPTEEDLDVLVAIAAHAAVAIEQAQVAAEAARERLAVERLLGVSAQLSRLDDRGQILAGVCQGVHDALGFARVAVMLADAHGVLRPAVTAGWREQELAALPGMPLDDVRALFDPALEREGCYLASLEHARARIAPELHDFFASTSNGRGRRAWNRHWLVVPLEDTAGVLHGLLWPDDPVDRLVPSAAKLKALRAFAYQAVSALGATRCDDRVRALSGVETGDELRAGSPR